MIINGSCSSINSSQQFILKEPTTVTAEVGLAVKSPLYTIKGDPATNAVEVSLAVVFPTNTLDAKNTIDNRNNSTTRIKWDNATIEAAGPSLMNAVDPDLSKAADTNPLKATKSNLSRFSIVN